MKPVGIRIHSMILRTSAKTTMKTQLFPCLLINSTTDNHAKLKVLHFGKN